MKPSERHRRNNPKLQSSTVLGIFLVLYSVHVQHLKELKMMKLFGYAALGVALSVAGINIFEDTLHYFLILACAAWIDLSNLFND